MKLSLNSRQVGEVTVITCGGRIVAGAESASLDDHVKKLLPLNRLIILHLGEVDFIDSSGIGLLVRLLTRTKTAGGDLKLCNLNPNLVHTLKITNLSTVFDTHRSETEAISAIYRRSRSQTGKDWAGADVLCVHESSDVLAYLQELLRNAGYKPLTASNPYDALILLKAVAPKLLIHDLNLRDFPSKDSRQPTTYDCCAAGLAAVCLPPLRPTLPAERQRYACGRLPMAGDVRRPLDLCEGAGSLIVLLLELTANGAQACHRAGIVAAEKQQTSWPY